MAYTFEELANWWPGKSYPVGHVKLLITQEDGRTAYARGFTSTFNSATNEFSGQFAQQFSDRTRKLNYGPPSNAFGFYDQNFDMNSGIDRVSFVFAKIGANTFELRLTLLDWGYASHTTSLVKASQAKIYTGWGATIAQGTASALYAFSLNDAEITPG